MHYVDPTLNYLLRDVFSNFVFSAVESSQASPRSKMVLVFRRAPLSILSVLVLIPKGLASSCIGN